LKVILGTSASSEGIDLKRVRQVHILEPYWNMVRNDQVIGRAVRFGSHVDLTENEQNVHVYSYQTTLTEPQQKEMVAAMDENIKEALSTDEYIHQLALRKNRISRQFLKMIKESAVDCGLNYLQNVKVDLDLKCMDIPADIGKYMYQPNINLDPEDEEFLENLKYESYVTNQIEFGDQIYGYKANLDGRPILDPPSIQYKGKLYYQILTLYNYDLLQNGVEVMRKYYVVGTDILIDT